MWPRDLVTWKEEGSTNVYILVYAFLYTSNNLDVRMCTNTFLWMGFHLQISSDLFSLGNATFAKLAKKVGMIKIKHIWKDISSKFRVYLKKVIF